MNFVRFVFLLGFLLLSSEISFAKATEEVSINVNNVPPKLKSLFIPLKLSVFENKPLSKSTESSSLGANNSAKNKDSNKLSLEKEQKDGELKDDEIGDLAEDSIEIQTEEEKEEKEEKEKKEKDKNKKSSVTRIDASSLNLKKSEFSDILFYQYSSQLVKDPRGEVRGISFVVTSGSELPSELSAKYRVSSKSSKLVSVSISEEGQHEFSKEAKIVKNAIVGMNYLEISSDEAEKNKHRSLREKDKYGDRVDEFYVKSFGKDILHSESRSNYGKAAEKTTNNSKLRSVNVFVYLPKKYDKLNEIYIPVVISKPSELEIENTSPNWVGSIIVQSNSKLIKINSLTTEPLPTGMPISFNLKIKDETRIDNSLYFGQVLEEPADLLPRVNVSITPAAFSLNEPIVDVADFFLLK